LIAPRLSDNALSRSRIASASRAAIVSVRGRNLGGSVDEVVWPNTVLEQNPKQTNTQFAARAAEFIAMPQDGV
jgi:hypothetical protein